MGKIKLVQSFITNMTTPTCLDELYDTYFKYHDVPILPDKLLYSEKDEPTDWTVPRWAKIGDIVFFMFAKCSSLQHLRNIRREFELRQDEFDYEKSVWLKFWLYHGLEMHRLYGGRIFAIGRVVGQPYGWEPSGQHWKSTIYAHIDDIVLLKCPVHLSEFQDFITISRQTAITGVFGQDFASLMALIENNNKLPITYRNLSAELCSLAEIAKHNWFEVSKKYRLHFFNESQFRAYCVDYFLREFGDIKTYYAEVSCYSFDKVRGFVDNLVKWRGKWLPVEVKLNVLLEQDICGQCMKYVHTDYMKKNERLFGHDTLYNDCVLVVDTNGFYLYKNNKLCNLVLWSDFDTSADLIMGLETQLLRFLV